jgi:hypothetical protein
MTMDDTTKNMWDVILNIVMIIGAGGAFLLGWYQWRRGQAWQRAAKGRELVDDLLKSDDSDEEFYAWDAMRMLDYQDAEKPLLTKPIDGRRHEVTRETIRKALQPCEPDESDTMLLYVRECFDELYFKAGQLQDAIDNDLVELQHVSCPVDYYVGLMSKDVKLHHKYLTEYNYPRTLKFLENFDCWRTARRKAEMKDPPEGD